MAIGERIFNRPEGALGGDNVDALAGGVEVDERISARQVEQGVLPLLHPCRHRLGQQLLGDRITPLDDRRDTGALIDDDHQALVGHAARRQPLDPCEPRGHDIECRVHVRVVLGGIAGGDERLAASALQIAGTEVLVGEPDGVLERCVVRHRGRLHGHDQAALLHGRLDRCQRLGHRVRPPRSRLRPRLGEVADERVTMNEEDDRVDVRRAERRRVRARELDAVALPRFEDLVERPDALPLLVEVRRRHHVVVDPARQCLIQRLGLEMDSCRLHLVADDADAHALSAPGGIGLDLPHRKVVRLHEGGREFEELPVPLVPRQDVDLELFGLRIPGRIRHRDRDVRRRRLVKERHRLDVKACLEAAQRDRHARVRALGREEERLEGRLGGRGPGGADLDGEGADDSSGEVAHRDRLHGRATVVRHRVHHALIEFGRDLEPGIRPTHPRSAGNRLGLSLQ